MELTDIKLFSPEIALIIGSIFILLYGIFFKDNTDSNKRDMFNRTFEKMLLGLVGENLDFYNKLKEPNKNRFMKDRMYKLYATN